MRRSILLTAQSKVHEHVERDAAVRQTKNVTDWSAPPPPTTGQLAVTAAPSRRGWTWLAAAWPVRCAQHQQQHAAVMTESHGWLYLSSHVLDLKYARITTDRRLEATVREVSISGCKKSHRRAPFDSEEQTVFNVANKICHYSPQEKVCWNFFEILK